jgi:hypothetical protein
MDTYGPLTSLSSLLRYTTIAHEAANAAEAIASANSERFKLTRATKLNQEGITTIQGTHHPSPTRSIPFQAHFYDDDDDNDDNYSIRSGDDCKKPALTCPNPP